MICISVRHRIVRARTLLLCAFALQVLSACHTVNQIKALVSGNAVWMHIDGPTTLNINTCSQGNAVSLLNGAGDAVTPDKDVVFRMKGPVQFFLDSSCTQLQDKFTLKAGQDSVPVYFLASEQGQKRLQATSSQIALDSEILEVDIILNAVLSVQQNPALGSWPVNVTSTFHFTLFNGGQLDATLKSAPTTSAPFGVQAGTCQGKLSSGNTCQFTVTFSPTASGSYRKDVVFAINDGIQDKSFTLTVSASTPNASGGGNGNGNGNGGGGGTVGGSGGTSSTSGTLDASFHSTGSVVTSLSATGGANAVVVQADGKIVVAGEQGTSVALLRYNTDGSLDTSFGSAGIATLSITGATARANALALQSDGSIVVAGEACGMLLARFKANGAIDTTFGTSGSIVTSVGSNGGVATAVAIQSDGKIVMGGHDYFDFRIARYNANGTADTSFGTSGMVTTDLNSGSVDQASALVIQSDGRIVQVGTSWGNGYAGAFAIVRYKKDGSYDTSFAQTGIALYSLGTGAGAVARAAAIQSDGKIIIAGDQSLQLALGRLNPDGTPDNSFGNGGEVLLVSSGQDLGRSIAVQSDGKILIAGSQRDPISGHSSIILVRIQASGSPDTGFATNAEAVAPLAVDSFGHGVALQKDGKIVVTGDSGGGVAVLRYLP